MIKLKILQKENPLKELSIMINSPINGFMDSGSTCILTRIYKDHIIVDYVGDSQVMILIDNICVYLNQPHNLANDEELERVKPFLRNYKPIEYSKKP